MVMTLISALDCVHCTVHVNIKIIVVEPKTAGILQPKVLKKNRELEKVDPYNTIERVEFSKPRYY